MRLGIVVLMLALAPPVWAQSLVVRSGEHGAFTRLVVPVPTDVDWELQQSGRELRLSVAEPDSRFDTSQVFSRIARDRVQDLSQAAAGADLVVRLACDCSAKAFRASPGFVAIDINDDPPQNVDLPLVAPIARPAVTAVATTVDIPVARLDTDLPSLLRASELRLHTQLNRAARQGVLEIQPDPGPEPSGDPETTAKVQIRATTVFDQGMAKVADRLISDQPPASCGPQDQYELPQWGGEAPFSVQLLKARHRIYGEFDRLNADAVLDLARIYLYFGFGLEAAHALDLLPAPDTQAERLRALARVIDDLGGHPDGPLSGRQHCDGPVAMWAVLADGALGKEADLQAIQQAHAALPDHLRRHLGPRLSEVLALSGQAEVADRVLRGSTRLTGAEDPDVQMAEAKIAKAEGDLDVALDHIEAVADTNSEHAPRAVIEQVETLWKTRQAPPEDLSDLIEAFLIEYRTAPLGEPLRRARVLTHAMGADFDTALAGLAELRKLDGSDAHREAMARIVPLVAELADDVTFLDYVLAHGDAIAALPESLSLNAVARRLLDLGFPTQARLVLGGDGRSNAKAPARLLRAEAWLDDGAPHRAMVELLGLSGPEADQLRLAAMWQNENYDEAAALAVSLRDADQAAASQFLAGDYAAIDPAQDTRFAQMASAAQQLDQSVQADLPPLGLARALLDDSTSARSEIEHLLTQARSPD